MLLKMTFIFLQKSGRQGGGFLQGDPAFLLWGGGHCPTVGDQNQEDQGSL